MNSNKSYGSKDFMQDVYDNLMKNQQHNPLDFSETNLNSCLDFDDLTITIGSFKLQFVAVTA